MKVCCHHHFLPEVSFLPRPSFHFKSTAAATARTRGVFALCSLSLYPLFQSRKLSETCLHLLELAQVPHLATAANSRWLMVCCFCVVLHYQMAVFTYTATVGIISSIIAHSIATTLPGFHVLLMYEFLPTESILKFD